MRVLLWNIHGGYSDSLLSGTHDYLYLPAGTAGSSGPPNLHRPSPGTVAVVGPAELRDNPPDVVVLQRLEELDWAAELGLRLGVDVPAVFCEHNTPRGGVPESRHPLADRPELTVVHVTHFNALFWDCGSTPTAVVEHGVADPGPRYTGELERLAFVVNEPVRRWRTTGSDLLQHFAQHPVDAYGIDADLLPAALPGSPSLTYAGNLAPEELYATVSRRRVYLHLNRWTSLGLSLIQAMMLGMPVVVLDTTEASRAVPPGAGALSSDIGLLVSEAAYLLKEPDEAAARGQVARSVALERYGIDRFVKAWDEVLAGAVRG